MTAETMMQNPNPRCWLITTPQGGDLHICAADGWRVEEIIGGTRMDEKLADELELVYKPDRATGRIVTDELLVRVCAALRAKEPGSAGLEVITHRDLVYYDLGWAACREAAAKECDIQANRDDLTGDYRYGAGICAATIRALQPPKE